MLQFLQQIGNGSVPALWVPVLAWTALASVTTLCLSLPRNHNPLGGYRLRQALLLALPASILAAPWLPGLSLPVVRAPIPAPSEETPRSLVDPAVPPAVSDGLDGALAPTNPVRRIADSLALPDIDIPGTLLGFAVVALVVLAFVRLAKLGVAMWRLRRFDRVAPCANHPPANRLLLELATQFGVRRPVELREGPPGCIPMTFGTRRPVVVVPCGLLESPDSLKTVLMHELVHVRRGDHVWAVLESLTAAAFAFHPLVWLLGREIQHYREASCDAEVLSAGKVTATQYAELVIATHTANRSAIAPLVASMFARRSALKRRLVAIGRFRDARRPLLRRGGVVFASSCLFAVLALASGSATVRDADIPSQRQPNTLPRSNSDAALQPGNRYRDCPECPEMVVVSAGTFTMGSPDSEQGRFAYEGPQHSVRIATPFAVGVYEVSFAEWDACVRAGGCARYSPEDRGWGRGNLPVMNVSWEDAQRYVRWLSRKTGENYRLPTEAEWEYVARGGTPTARYWGEGEVELCRYANGYDRTAHATNPHWENPIPCTDHHAQTAPVGSFEPNAFGLYDVMGNVWEWTQDCWTDDYTGAAQDGRARESLNCSLRVLRGGSWSDVLWGLRSADRLRFPAGIRNSVNGFRVARTIGSAP